MSYFNRTAELEKALVFYGPDPKHPWGRGPSRTDVVWTQARPMDSDPTRWEVIRTGRTEADGPLWPVRRAVAYRDHMTCRLCHTPEKLRLEVDHIIPWSAGGSDTTSNLRLLCLVCNQRRGNSIDGTERDVMPATWWCVECWGPDNRLWHQPWAHEGDATEWLNISHRVDSDHDYVTAYCATCHHISSTDVTL